MDSSDQNSSDTSDQGVTDSGVSDGSTDPGLTDDSGSDTMIRYYIIPQLIKLAIPQIMRLEAMMVLEHMRIPTFWHLLMNLAYTKIVSAENSSVQFDPDQVGSSVQFDPDQVKNDAIPMQKTGAPILPAVTGIITIMGGFLVNRFKS